MDCFNLVQIWYLLCVKFLQFCPQIHELLEARIRRFPAQKLSHFCAIVDLGNAHSCQLLVKSEKKNKLKYLSINTLTPRKSDFYFVLPKEQPLRCWTKSTYWINHYWYKKIEQHSSNHSKFESWQNVWNQLEMRVLQSYIKDGLSCHWSAIRHKETLAAYLLESIILSSVLNLLIFFFGLRQNILAR